MFPSDTRLYRSCACGTGPGQTRVYGCGCECVSEGVRVALPLCTFGDQHRMSAQTKQTRDTHTHAHTHIQQERQRENEMDKLTPSFLLVVRIWSKHFLACLYSRLATAMFPMRVSAVTLFCTEHEREQQHEFTHSNWRSFGEDKRKRSDSHRCFHVDCNCNQAAK